MSRDRRSVYRDAVAKSLISKSVSVCPFDFKPCWFPERFCEIPDEILPDGSVSSWFCARCPAGNVTWGSA